MKKRHNLVVIGDTHFGVRNNSMTWLKHQAAGFREIIRYVEDTLENYDWTHVVHVGDLFDSRSSINPLVWREVVSLLTEMDETLTHGEANMTILGGNHDYYYPWESEHNFTGIQMLPTFRNINTITDTCSCRANHVMIPWFTFHNKEMLRDVMGRIYPGDTIITHTDPWHMDPEIVDIIKDHPLITGHIHQPYHDEGHHILVTGATYPIDFSDTNSQRGFWNIEEEFDTETRIATVLSVIFHLVESSIHFHTIMEDDLTHWRDRGIDNDDYVEIVIRQSHMDIHKDTIKALSDKFNTSVIYMAESGVDTILESREVLTVDTVCQRMLPEKLKSLYHEMAQAI